MNFIKRFAATAVMSLLDEKAEEDAANASPWAGLVALAIPLVAAGIPAVVDRMKRGKAREQEKDARIERLETLLGPQLEELELAAAEKEEYEKARELLSQLETAKFTVKAYQAKQEKRDAA